MDRAFVGNLQQLDRCSSVGPVRWMSRSILIEHSFFGFAFRAIGGVDLRVAQMNRDLLERPCLAPSIHPTVIEVHAPKAASSRS